MFHTMVTTHYYCDGLYPVPGACGPDEFDAGYSTCLAKQPGVDLAACPLDPSTPGAVATCQGSGWIWIHVGGKITDISFRHMVRMGRNIYMYNITLPRMLDSPFEICSEWGQVFQE